MMADDQRYSPAWSPPSPSLRLHRDIWHPETLREVSYPTDGNDAYAPIEETSYWFKHRNSILLAAFANYPPAGDIYDIGGGNGIISSFLQQHGFGVVLVEPGTGAMKARQRGVQRIVRSTLEDANFLPSSITSAGAFDVLEHTADDVAFIDVVRELLQPGGRFYVTVPALGSLWSGEDVAAGHYRRYSPRTLARAMRQGGLEVEFVSYFFSWLIGPIFLMRTLPFRLSLNTVRRMTSHQIHAAHSLPAWLYPVVERAHRWEEKRIRDGRRIPTGTSLLCVARRTA